MNGPCLVLGEALFGRLSFKISPEGNFRFVCFVYFDSFVYDLSNIHDSRIGNTHFI